MTMIRPKIKGLPMTKPKKSKMKTEDILDRKGYGKNKGGFLGDQAGVK